MLYRYINEENRQKWLKKSLSTLADGERILDAGAGELANKPLCSHLVYISQDFGQYSGAGDGSGFQTGQWNTSMIDHICDICSIPEHDSSFDAILCTEVFEHLPDPLKALDEFQRLLKPGGKLILTAPFFSCVHFAPYHYSTGFSRYWYEHHLKLRDLKIIELTPNGDWFDLCHQELVRLGSMARRYRDWSWPLAYVLGIFGILYFKIRRGRTASDVAAFGWQCIAIKDIK